MSEKETTTRPAFFDRKAVPAEIDPPDETLGLYEYKPGDNSETGVYVVQEIFTSEGWVPPVGYSAFLKIVDDIERGYSPHFFFHEMATSTTSYEQIDPKIIARELNQGETIVEKAPTASGPYLFLEDDRVDLTEFKFYIPDLGVQETAKYLSHAVEVLSNCHNPTDKEIRRLAREGWCVEEEVVDHILQ